MKYTTTILFLFLFSIAAVAQTPTATFKKLLPEMGADDPGKREAAQRDWQDVCMAAGAPGKAAELKEVNGLMVEALAVDTPLETKLWLLQQLQWTGDASVVPTLVKLLDDKEVRLFDRAARALALNPSPEAAAALKAAADKLEGIRGRAAKDAESARKPEVVTFKISKARDTMELPYVDAATFDKAVAGFDKADAQEQARILAAITVRKDQKSLPVVVKAVGGGDEFVKKNAVLALAKIGTAKEVPLLVGLLNDYDRGLVETVLIDNAEPGVDDALIQVANAETDFDRFDKVAIVLARRNCTKILPTILERAAKADCPNRKTLLAAAEPIAKATDLGKFVDIALMIEPGRDRDDAERIIARIAQGNAETVIAKFNDANTSALLTMIGRIGGPQALDAVKKHRGGKFENDAIRALCNWPNAVVADDLLTIAEDSQASEQNRVAAVRAFGRVISLPDDQIGIKISGKDKVAKLDKGISVATRLEDKRFILSRLDAIRIRESAELAIKYLDNADLKEEAQRKVVDLAHHNDLRRANKPLFEPALKRVLTESNDNGLKDRAQRYLEAP
jgi:HEAT repeat protein